MNKFEIKYLLEQMTSSVDRLTDVAGKQVNHIDELWSEIGHKNNKINSLNEKIFEKNAEIQRLQEIIKTQQHKDLSEHFFPEQRRKLLAQKKLEDDKPFTKIANNLGKKELKPFKKIPKKSTPIDIPLPDINYNLYMQSKEQLFKPDPYLDELKKKVDLAQEQSYQEKVKNNTSGLRSFAPLEVKRDYNE